MKLNFDSIVMRVVEHGWENQGELEMVTDMIIEADSMEYFLNKPGRLSDLEDVFEYTAQLRKKVVARAVEIEEEQKKKLGQPNNNGDDSHGN